MKRYTELNEEERKEVDKKIEYALDSTSNYKGERPTPHDRNIIRNYLKEDLSWIKKIK